MSDDNFHQKLISEAYELWEKNKDWSYEEFINALDEKHKVAVLVGDFDYQMKKGGFVQWYWHWNKYPNYPNKVVDLLIVLNGFVKDTNSGVGKKVINLIEIYLKGAQLLLYNSVEQERLLTREYLEISKYFIEEFNAWLMVEYSDTEKENQITNKLNSE